MLYERCEIFGNVSAFPNHVGTGFEDDAKQTYCALVNRRTAGRDRTPLLSTRTREHDDVGLATAEVSTGSVRREVQHQETAWMGATFG